MMSCWNACPSERPSFSQLKTSFEILLEEVSHYLNLEFNESAAPVLYCNTASNHYDKC